MERIRETPSWYVILNCGKTFEVYSRSSRENQTTTRTSCSNLSQKKEAKSVQSSRDLGRGGFGFWDEENIKGLVPNKPPHGVNCNRPEKPPTISRKKFLWCWGGLTKPYCISVSKVIAATAETSFFFLLLAALNKALWCTNLLYSQVYESFASARSNSQGIVFLKGQFISKLI